MQLTIFTPTYNRCAYLERLYCSLLKQSSKDFKWIIVDDGSDDNTDEVIKKFIDDDKLKIMYYKQENSGKHIAHNKGVEMCDTELFFCVDSDDYITEDSVETILNIWNSREKNKKTIGIVALKGYKDGSVMGNNMPKGIEYSTLSNLYNIHRKKGETALIFKTEYLKMNYFPKFNNENFLSEEVVYNKLDDIGELIVSNKVIYIMEYLENGLTKNYINMWKRNPNGTICLLKSRYNKVKKITSIRKLYLCSKCIIVLNAFCINRRISILDNTPNKYLSFILLIPSIFVSRFKFK